MQCRYNILSLALWVSLFLCLPHLAQAGDVQLIRSVEKAFTAYPSQRVQVKNQYGRIRIISTNEQRILLKATIVGRGSTEAIAQRMIDEVAIATSSDRELLSVRTETPRSPGLKLGDVGLSVSYTLEVPIGQKLDIYNSFGDIELGDRDGDVEVKIKNGKLIAGNLASNNNYLNGHFSHAQIDYFKAGEIVFKYGHVTISEAGDLNATVTGGDLTIGLVEHLDISVKHGKASIGRVEVIEGQYSSELFSLGFLGKSMDMEVKYAEAFTVGEVGKNFSEIDLKGSYTPINLNCSPEAGFRLEAELTKGELAYEAPTVSMTVIEHAYNQDCGCREKEYLGRFGPKGSGVIRLECDYGTVRITQ